MKRLHLVLLVATASVLWWSVPSAHAQRPSRSPFRTRPALSPWFDLYRSDPGPLGNYHSYVRPRMELQETLDQQRAGLRQQGARINSLGRQMSAMQQAYPIRPTGTASSFMNYSHYYSYGGR